MSIDDGKLELGELVNRIKNYQQSDWVKACRKLDLYMPDGGGKGSHVAVYKEHNCDRSDSTMLLVTIPSKMYAQIQRDYVKKLVAWVKASSRYTEDDVWKALGVKF